MGFSLRGLVKQVGNDINPFDGPKPAPPPPATTAQQPQHFSPIAQQRIMARNPSGGAQQIARGVQYGSATPQAVQQPNLFKQNAEAFGLAAARTATGIAQAGSGLVDLASPGKGTSHVSQALNRAAVSQDKTANRLGVNAGYKTFQAPLNVATFLTPGAVAGAFNTATKGATAVNDASKLATLGRGIEATKNAFAPTTKLVDNTAAKLATHGPVGRITGAAVKGGASGSNVLNAAGMTALQTGTQASKGQDVSPLGTAATFGANLAFGAALPAAGQTGLELGKGAVVAGKAGVKAARAGADHLTPSFNGLKAKQVIMDTNKLDILHNALQPTAPSNVAMKQSISEGLHQIKQDHGLDFISGTPNQRAQRISQYLEQNGEAIPQLQAHQAKMANIRNTAIDVQNKFAPGLRTNAVNDAGEQLGLNGEPLKTSVASPTKPVPILPDAVVPTRLPKSPVVGEKPVNGSLGNDTPKVVQNSLTAGGKAGRQNISPEVQAGISGEGTVRNTQQLQDKAVKTANKTGLNKTIHDAHESLAVAPGHIDDSTVASVQQAIERADKAGRTQDAITLHDALSEHLRKQGQTIQAASLLYKLSPQGRFFKAIRDLKRSGTVVSPELQGKLKVANNAIDAAKTSKDKTMAQAKFQKLVADNLKQKAGQNLISVWKAGLLSGPLTQAGNFASNATFAVMHKISDAPATVIDKLLSVGTGQRTKTFTSKGYLSGAKEGVGTGVNTMKTGIDVRNIEGNKYEIHGEINFKNPVIQNVFGKTSNLVFRGMSAADQPFYYAALKNNLADIAKADGLSKGLSGKGLAQHVAKTMNNPTKHMAETAKLAAQKSVLGQDSKVASSISKIAQNHPILQAVVPFVKVPTNFLTRTLDFTPAGAAKVLFRQARAGKLDQRALSEALGEAVTGTGVIAIGAELANSNLLSGQYPSGDQKEVQRWKVEGIQPNSVKVGDKWVNLNYLGPLGLLLGAGKDYHQAASHGDSGAMQAIAGFGKGLAGQSFLTGFSGAANAIQDPGRYGANFVHSQASSVVPAWLNAVGNATDSNQRQASSTIDSVKSRIPVIRTSLPVKNDVYGNPLKQRTNPLDLSTNPLKPSRDLSQKNPVVSEVNRLHTVDPNNADLQVTPTPVTSLNVEGKTVKLNGRQKYDVQKQIGQNTQKNWGELIKSPEYAAMNDTQKAAALDNVRKLSTEDATRAYVVNNNLGTYNKPESTKAIALAHGDSVASLASSKATGGTSSTSSSAYYKSPDAEYKAAQKSFDDKVKNNGFNSAAQRIKAQDSLNKAKVGSSYDKNIRDAYGLSDGELYGYVSTDPNGKAIADKVVAYDDALVKAGVIAKNKYRDKYGNVTIGKSTLAKASGRRSGSGRTRGSGTSNSKFAAALKASNSADSANQTAIRNLVKNAKVGAGKAPVSRVQVASVNLKKQTIKQRKVRAVA